MTKIFWIRWVWKVTKGLRNEERKEESYKREDHQYRGIYKYKQLSTCLKVLHGIYCCITREGLNKDHTLLSNIKWLKKYLRCRLTLAAAARIAPSVGCPSNWPPTIWALLHTAPAQNKLVTISKQEYETILKSKQHISFFLNKIKHVWKDQFL